MNLMQLVSKDLKSLNIQNWGVEIFLTDPNGIEYKTDAETGEPLNCVRFQSSYKRINPDTGEEFIVQSPIVIFALSSLSKVPLNGENWKISIPENLNNQSTKTTYILSSDRAFEVNNSLNIITFYPHKAEQIDLPETEPDNDGDETA